MDSIIKKKIDYLYSTTMIFIGISIIFVYLFRWWKFPSIYYPEMNYMLGNHMDNGMQGVRAFVSTIFDLNKMEGGGYRPRMLGFAIQYFDIKWWLLLNKKFPFWGGHWPMAVLCAMPVMILGIYSILRQLFYTQNKACVFCMSSVSLFIPQYLGCTYRFDRTAKLVAPGCCMVLLAFFLAFLKENDSTSKFKYALYSLFLFLLDTVDEHVLFLNVMCFLLLIVVSKIDRSVKKSGVIVMGLAIAQYLFFYYGWGRLLYSRFSTGEITKHYHNSARIIKNLLPAIYEGMIFYVGSIKRLLLDNLFLVLICVIIYFLFWFKVNNPCTRFISLSLIVFGYILSVISIAAHPKLYLNISNRNGLYYITNVCLFACGYLVLVANCMCNRSEYKNTFKYIVILSLLYFSFVNSSFEKYHLSHFYQSGEIANPEYENIDGVPIEYFGQVIRKKEDAEKYINNVVYDLIEK